MTKSWRVLAAIGVAAAAFATPAQAAQPKCLFVSSYHQGYAWSDGVERGLRATLAGKCEIRQYDMDTKRRKSDEEITASVAEARALIEDWRPDVVIAADDHAAKHLIQPYYKDAALPFVFCGVNWSADAYGFPYENVTGMVEVAPIGPMLESGRELAPGLKRAFYLGADTMTEVKNLNRIQEATAAEGIRLDHALATTAAAWLEAFGRAQEYDLVILGSSAGVADWDEAAMVEAVRATGRRPSVTNHDWMMPYAMLGFTKVPEEQGEWAGQVALQILAGMAPARIPIVANRRRDVWINFGLVEEAGVSVPDAIARKAKRVGSPSPKS